MVARPDGQNGSGNSLLSSSPTAEAIRIQLGNILRSDRFKRSKKLSRFLEFVVEETLTGSSESLKEYRIGVEVFERGESFDMRLDSIVRVEAGKLRARLREYYEQNENGNLVLIELPKGGYVPAFRLYDREPADALPRSAHDVQKEDAVAKARSDSQKRRLDWVAPSVLLLAAAVGLLVWQRTKRPGPVFPQQVTFDSGWTAQPSVSRDGRLMAFASDRGVAGNADIWIQRLDGKSEPVQLTHHETHEISPDIAPDGSQVVFRSFRHGGGVYIVSVLGGSERKLADNGYVPRLSPDGAWVAYSAINGRGAQSIFIVSASGGEAIDQVPDARNAGDPVWTPDGKHLLFRDAVDEAETDYDWYSVAANMDRSAQPRERVRTGVAEVLRRSGIKGMTHLQRPEDWFSAHEVLFAGIYSILLSTSTWKAKGMARQVFVWPGAERVRSVPETRNRLFFSAENTLPNIWGFPVDANRGTSAGPPQKLTQDTSVEVGLGLQSPRVSQDGKWLVFVSKRADDLDVSLKNLETGVETQLVRSPLREESPLINARGTKVIFLRTAEKRKALYVADIKSGQMEKICEDCGRAIDWSRDDGKVLFLDSAGTLYALDLKTRSKKQILGGRTYTLSDAALSPDGKWITLVFKKRHEDFVYGVIAPTQKDLTVEEGHWLTVAKEPYDLSLRWSPNGKLIYFMSTRDHYRCVWALAVNPGGNAGLGEAFPVVHFHKYQRYPWNTASLSVAQDKLVVPLTDRHSNIWTVDLSR